MGLKKFGTTDAPIEPERDMTRTAQRDEWTKEDEEELKAEQATEEQG